MSRRGGRGGGSAAAYQQRMMLQERPPPLRTLAPHLPDPSKGRLFTITTVPLKGKRLDTILSIIAEKKKAQYEARQKVLRAMALKAHEAGKDKEPTLRHTGLSALEGAEASTGEAEGAVVDVDKEFLSEEFRTNCTPRDVERLRNRITELKQFQTDLLWLQRKVQDLEKKHIRKTDGAGTG